MTAKTLPKGIVQLPNGRYRTQIRRAGFKPFDFVSADLERVIGEHAAEIARQQGISDTGVTMTLCAAAAAYFESPLFDAKAEKTKYEERRNLVPVLAELGEHTLVYINNNLSVVTRYRDQRLKTISTRTKKRVTGAKTRVELAALSSIFRWAVDQHLFTKNCIDGVNRGTPSPPRKRRYEGNEETKLALLAQNAKDPLDAQAARFLLIQLELGCRPGELAELLMADINLKDKEAIFRDTKIDNKDRNVYLTDIVVEVIGQQMMYTMEDNAQRLFFSRNQKTKEEVAYNYAHWVKKFRTGGILGAGFVAHAGRKEFVSRGLESDINVSTLQMMTGHATLQSIERYRVDLRMNDKTRAVFDAHSEELQIRAAEKAFNELPLNLRQLFLERKKKQEEES